MDLSKLNVEINCPNCKNALGDHVTFRWGVCPRATRYELGEPVEWLMTEEGAYLPPGQHIGELFNAGRPELQDVLVRDCSEFQYGTVCPICEEVYAGVVTAVKGGKFAGASIFERGDLPTDDDVFEVKGDRLVPHPEFVTLIAGRRA